MSKNILGILLGATIIAFFAGCAGMKANEPPLMFTPHPFEAGQYSPKVENFLFILDASYTMEENDQRNFRTAKNVISSINQSLPAGLDFTAGLRTFGHHPRQSEKLTELVYGMTKYTRAGLQQGLDRVKYAGGNSPLPEALAAAGKDLQGTQGRTAIIIVSDGKVELGMAGAPAAAANLKKTMGDRLCIYTIAVGGDPAGEKFLEEVARAGGCGFAVTAASLAVPGNLASYVEKVFLTAKPAPVAAVAPRDSDGDGVIDARDKCPDTPRGELVDEDGCTLKLTLHINFDFDKAEIKPEFEPDLKKAAEFISEHKDVPYILIEGHTDSIGDAAYNQQLSARRAEAVKHYLIENYQINPQRLVTRGRGESNPVADNSTEEGRYQNRRVEIICCVFLPAQ